MRILTLGALFLLSAAQAQPTGVPLSCAAASRPELIGLPTDGSDLVLDIRSGPAWLEIEEAGQRVIVADAPPDAITVPQPLRFGWHWLPVDAGMKLAVRRSVAQSRATGAIKSTLHCAPTAKVLARIDWLRRAGAIGASIDKPVAAGAFAQSLATVRALVDDAPSQLERAIALHFVAEAFGANSRGGDAVSAFALAEQAWSALGDHERALAARLGRIEELRSTDSYQAVLDQTPDVSTLRGRQTYFSTRLENPRCLSL